MNKSWNPCNYMFNLIISTFTLFKTCIVSAVNFISGAVMYSFAYLITENHLNYFIYPITIIITLIITGLIVFFLKIFNIYDDNLKNDANILRSVSPYHSQKNRDSKHEKHE
jgi:phosphotransferase system  glucose/maltose/N-acetylglucosamine-specific IIC component